MIKNTIAISTIFLTSCFSGPEFVPVKRVDSPMVMSLKKELDTAGGKNNYGWLFWYVPVASVAIMWSYKEFIRKKPTKDGN